ncbi:MAG: bifunctional (p)ppGpp synthetase/guanosine-3',5'-bis(diphosphate) 3'-pyrophosphohydrolase [Bacteroidales bacterium]|nr:bifunctional (p)ppGpp synthetase/guanosine-3',5'-bis(diphosphate) 3'-pyrophosphohydrolase [Bacteroidales bacterium]
MERIEKLFPAYTGRDKELVTAAYAIASKALDGMKRGNGAPFIEHPENVAKIAADEIGLGPECIAAVFLHEATRDRSDIDLRSVGHFGRDILTMVDGLNKIATIKPKDTRLEADNYKKLIVSYSTDPRVVVLKLADRLEVMRSLELFPKASRERKQLETLLLYIPLAHQLGLYNMKSEMEDIYFKYAEPEEYRAITNRLKATERDRQLITTQFIEPLKAKLSEAGIKYKLKARTKTAFSIWKKMQKQKVDFDGVYDVFAIRFIIDCEEDRAVEHALCWKVFGFVTEEYESDTSRLRDWISNPKPNGYESLHITVKNAEGACLEVQIRTKRMDEMAESGLASHWSYKGIKQEAALDTWLNAVRSSLEHGSSETLSPPDYDGEDDLPAPPSKEIFVFTPSGELRKLASGSSVLDFAFNIHSGIGAKCTGARVNGKAVSIKEKLSTGDVVEIMTGKNQRPTQDWLNWVVTSKAKSRIKHELKEAEFKKAAEGRELLERRLKNWKLELPDSMMRELMKKYKYSSINSFLGAVGEGTVDINDIKAFIQAQNAPAEDAQAKPEELTVKDWKGNKSSDDILVLSAKDVKGLDYRMARCCNPVYGDDVFGFVTRGEGIKIHRITCPNAARLLDRYPYRIQRVVWSETPSSGDFLCTLKILADMDHSVMAKIMEVVSNFKASIRSFNVGEDNRNGCYDIAVRILVPSNMELDKVISQVSALKHVIKVKRV